MKNLDNSYVEKQEIKKLFKEYKKKKDPKLREKLILLHNDLVHNLVKRFINRGEPTKDLIQVAQVGLINAIERYNFKKGVEFTTFATPTILGEIKRYFRDKGWTVRVPRRLQELNRTIMKSIDELTQRLSRSPKIYEIAKEVNVSEEEVLEALELGTAYNPLSLDSEFEITDSGYPISLIELTGKGDKELEEVDERELLKDVFLVLPEKERKVLYWRFYKHLTQSEIATRLGLSQMQVSRLQYSGLHKVKEFLQKGEYVEKKRKRKKKC